MVRAIFRAVFLSALIPSIVFADGEVATRSRRIASNARIVSQSGYFAGSFSYSVGGGQAVLKADSVTNNGTSPAQFRFALWWGASAYTPGANGHETAYYNIGTLNAGQTVSGVNSAGTAVPFTDPGNGCYSVALLLEENVNGTWTVDDYGNFSLKISSGQGCLFSFAANPTSISSGGSSTLSWSTGGTSVTISNGVGSQPASGSIVVRPTQTTSYVLTVNGTADGSPRTATATVTVAAVVPVPTITFSAAPGTIASGSSATLTWSTTNATSVTIDNGIGGVSVSGSRSVSPTLTTTYTLTATGSGGTANAQATVSVVSACQNPVITSITATPSQVMAGENVTLAVVTPDTISSYEWYRQNAGETNAVFLGGERTMTLQQVDPSSNYWVRLHGSCSSTAVTTSQQVTVTIDTGSCRSRSELCVNNNRYRITLTARDSKGASANGVALYQTNLFGFFSLPSFTGDAKNPEVFMKVLGPVDGVPWFFFSGLTNLDYTINVFDAVTGQQLKDFRVTAPPAGSLQSKGDYDVNGARSSRCDPVTVTTRQDPITICSPDASTLCLFNLRFRVTLSAKDDPKRTGNTAPGRALPRSEAFGFFSIPGLSNDPTNLEVFVKMVDARALDGHYWVFLGGLTDLEYTLTVTDTPTGKTKIYNKPLGSTCGWNDTAAF